MSTDTKWVVWRAAVAGGIHRFSVCALVKRDNTTSPTTCHGKCEGDPAGEVFTGM